MWNKVSLHLRLRMLPTDIGESGLSASSNIDISKQAESDLLEGEDVHPGTHRNRQTGVIHTCAHNPTLRGVNTITENHI